MGVGMMLLVVVVAMLMGMFIAVPVDNRRGLRRPQLLQRSLLDTVGGNVRKGQPRRLADEGAR